MENKVVEKTTIEEHKEVGCMIGYALTENDAWCLVAVHNEEEADRLLQEYKDSGKINLVLAWHGRATQTIEPVAAAKFVSPSVFMKHTTFVLERSEDNETEGTK